MDTAQTIDNKQPKASDYPAEKNTEGKHRSKFVFRSIRTKLTFLIIFCGLVPLIFFGIFNLVRTSVKIESDLKQELLLITEVEELQVYTYTDSLKSWVSDFATDTFARDSLKQITQKGPNFSKVQELLNTYFISEKKTLDPHIVGIFATDTKGEIVAATDKTELGQNESKDLYFIAGKKGVSLTTYQDEVVHFEDEDVFIVTAPLLDRNSKELLGVLAVIFDTRKMDSIFSGQFAKGQGALTINQGFPETLEIYMVNQKKKMFVFPTGTNKQNDPTKGKVMDTLPIVKCQTSQEEYLGKYTTYDGQKVIGSAMCFPDFGWILVAEMHESVLTSFIDRALMELMVASMFVVGVLLILTVFMVRSVTSPIQQLRRATKQIIAGNLDIVVPVQTQDEIGQLADDFGEMVAEVKASQSGLEEQVQKKTKELSEKVQDLEKTNELMIHRELKMVELKEEIASLEKSKK